MKNRLMWVFIPVLAGCAGVPVDNPRELQATLATMLRDLAQCPSGTSADLQALINATAADGFVPIPAGCFEVTDTVAIPPGIRLFGAGMDKTILYRDPDRSHDQDQTIFWTFGRGESEIQVSGIAFLGVRDTKDTGGNCGIVFSNSRNFRVDHCYFEGFGFAGIRTEGTSRGVIDHSIFVDNFKKGIDNLGTASPCTARTSGPTIPVQAQEKPFAWKIVSSSGSSMPSRPVPARTMSFVTTGCRGMSKRVP